MPHVDEVLLHSALCLVNEREFSETHADDVGEELGEKRQGEVNSDAQKLLEDDKRSAAQKCLTL